MRWRRPSQKATFELWKGNRTTSSRTLWRLFSWNSSAAESSRYRGAVSSEAASQIRMMEPLARAYERSISRHPKDEGLFGPQSIVWRVHRDRRFPLAAIRSLMVQALHPLGMAGGAQHSDLQHDPFGRLAAPAGYILTVTYR